jgi:predicted Zn-dependent protease
LRQNDFKTSRALALRATQMPWVDAQAYELLAVLDNKEKGEVNPLRLRLAARTGAPNWNIEKRYVRFMDESGATDAAIRELQTCLQTQWYRAESWQLLEQLLTKIGMTNEAAIARGQAAAYDVHLNAHATVL